MPDYSSMISDGMGSNATTTNYAKGLVDTVGKGLGDYADTQAKEAAANRPLSAWEKWSTAIEAGMDPHEAAVREQLGMSPPQAQGLGATSTPMATPGGGPSGSMGYTAPQPMARPSGPPVPQTQRDMEATMRTAPYRARRDVAQTQATSRENVAGTQVQGAQALEGAKQTNRVTNQEDAQKNQADRDAAARAQQDKITRETLDAAAERARMYADRAREEVRSGRGDKKMQALIAIKQRKFDRLSKALDDLVGNYRGRTLGQIGQSQIDQAKHAVDEEGSELDLLLQQEMEGTSAPAQSNSRTITTSTKTKGMKPAAAKAYQTIFGGAAPEMSLPLGK